MEVLHSMPELLTGEALNLGMSFSLATAEKVLKALKAGCSGYRTRTKSQMSL